MKLEQITIENFRPYLGKQHLYFSFSREKNVTLIYGHNGVGKSNLFKALNWCLYGKNALNDNNSEIVNKAAIEQSADNKPISVSVSVVFSHEGKKYSMTRTIEYNKKTDTKTEENPVMYVIESNGNTEKIVNPVGMMNSILPENVRTYFLFDGEKIEAFSKPSSAADVKNAIYNVLKLEVLERGKEHLTAVADEYQKELRKIASTELQSLLDSYKEKKDREEALINRQKELDSEISHCDETIRAIEQALQGLKESRELQKERERLENIKSQKEQERTDTVERIRKIVTGPAVSVNRKIIQDAITLLESKRIKGEIPSNIRHHFLQDIIDSTICICGRPFEQHGPEHKKLQEIQHSTVSGALEEEVISLNGNLRGLQNEITFNAGLLTELKIQEVKLGDDIEEKDAELSELSQKLKESRSEDVEKLEINRGAFKADLQNAELEKRQNGDKLTDLHNQLKELDEDIKKTRKDKDEEMMLSNKRSIALKGAEAIEAIYGKFADDMRSLIEVKTKDIFQQLIWKQSQFKQVQLGSDYHLEVIDRWNTPASGELSAGERQLLSLAFIAAMAKESGEEAPIVMDTPFGRLSSIPRENITSQLPALTHQLILFITDEEMTENMLANLAGRVGETYLLKFDSTTGCTHIERQ